MTSSTLCVLLVGLAVTVLHAAPAAQPPVTIDEAILAAMNESALEREEGVVRVELDMMFTQEDYDKLQAHKEAANKPGKEAGKYAGVIGWRWTQNTIPYSYWGWWSAKDRGIIQGAMAEWNHHTCLTWVPRSNQKNYVNIANGAGCFSYIGMIGNSQQLTLAPNCRIHSLVMHELGHAIGFHHEQNRPDRDGYVTVMTQNIPPSLLYAFKKYGTDEVDSRGIAYDYRSVMHYGETAFSINRRPTMITRDPAYQKIIGTAPGASFEDIKLANLMYNCAPAHCAGKKCPGIGFVDQHCKCLCPGTPTNPTVECGGGGGDGGSTTTNRPVPTTTKSPVVCEDKNKLYCPYWVGLGYCTHPSYKAFMEVNCMKSCGLC